MAVAAFWGPSMMVLLIPSVLVMIVGLFAYSYFIWKNDPQKQTVGR